MSWKVLVTNVRAYRKMFSHNLYRSMIKSVFFTNILITIADSVKIEKVVVPEVVQSGNASGTILDCIYTGDVSDQFILQWLFNGSEPPVYEWTPYTEPQVGGILNTRLDLAYKSSASPLEERRALRIIDLEPELSGDYTCRILDQGTEVHKTKSMMVFSPERDFLLKFYRHGPIVDIICVARGLYPQPDVILQHNGVMFRQQQLRMWRSEGLLYDAETTAKLTASTFMQDKPEKITCRLQIPQAGYTAIRNEFLYLGNERSNRSSKTKASILCLLLMTVNCFK